MINGPSIDGLAAYWKEQRGTDLPVLLIRVIDEAEKPEGIVTSEGGNYDVMYGDDLKVYTGWVYDKVEDAKYGEWAAV